MEPRMIQSDWFGVGRVLPGCPSAGSGSSRVIPTTSFCKF